MITDPPHLGYENKECIYDEELTSQSSVTISDLDGDADRGYTIVIDGICALTSDPYLTSSCTDSWVGQVITWRTSNTTPLSGDGVSSGRPKLGAGFLADGSNHQLYIEADLIVRAGRRKWFKSFCQFRYPGFAGGSINSVHHDSDATTPLSWMTLNFGGNFTGNVKVYRVLPK